MEKIRLIDIKQHVLQDNSNAAAEVRKELFEKQIFMLNLMASPGAGKTSLIIETIRRLKTDFKMGIIEGDIESIVDSEKIAGEGIPAVQLRTGGACHLDAPMIDAALQTMDLSSLDLIITENIGNLVCPAEFDIGETRKVMILSIPEGDDKVLKYPLMFSICDALVISKMDYLPLSDFNIEVLRQRVTKLNPKIKIFEISCKTQSGLEEWCQWLTTQVIDVKRQ